MVPFLVFIAAAAWLLFAYVGSRTVYFEFLQYASVTGPHWEFLLLAILIGPLSLATSTSDVLKKSFELRPKSPNPYRASYVVTLGNADRFNRDLAKWNMFRKVLLIKPWDQVDCEPLTGLDRLTRAVLGFNDDDPNAYSHYNS